MPTSFVRAAALLATPALSALLAGPLHAANPQDAYGLWLTGDKRAVVEVKECPKTPNTLCAQIVWDMDKGGPHDSCGTRIAQLGQWDGQAWRDGWIYDPREKKSYSGVVRTEGNTLKARAYIGAEIIGMTEQMTRTASLPGPACRRG